MLNNINLMGRLTANPELRKTPNGVSVATFTLAVDRDIKGQDGNRETDFITCVAWRNTADFLCKYFSKGSMAALTGRLTTRKYEDKNGQKRTAVEVVSDNLYFGESKPRVESTKAAETPAVFPVDVPDEYEDGDLPF